MRGRMWAEIISTVEEGGGAAPHHLLGLFQISLHDLLTRFLTGIWDLERLSKVVFPQRFFFTSHALTRTLLDLRTLLSGLEKGGVAVSGKLREALGRTLPGGAIRAEELARFVSEGYLFLSGSIERCGGGVTEECRVVNAIEWPLYLRVPFLAPLTAVKVFAEAALKPYLRAFLLHGSLATLDYLEEYSDVDTLLVVAEETLFDPERLLKLAVRTRRLLNYFWKIDPFQHHGPIVLAETDMRYYPPCIFALPIVERSKTLIGGSATLAFHARNCRLESLILADGLLDAIGAARDAWLGRDSFFAWKLAVSQTLMVPALMLGIDEIWTWKRDSFRTFYERYAGLDSGLVREAEERRIRARRPYRGGALSAPFSNPYLNFWINRRRELLEDHAVEDASGGRAAPGKGFAGLNEMLDCRWKEVRGDVFR